MAVVEGCDLQRTKKPLPARQDREGAATTSACALATYPDAIWRVVCLLLSALEIGCHVSLSLQTESPASTFAAWQGFCAVFVGGALTPSTSYRPCKAREGFFDLGDLMTSASMRVVRSG